ncbi:hypothetical protein JTE90_002818 [Oedothorax gibbosus]|uniref:Uncharacterized protein n=1 Tax=Oedothorax gibbosus TaxID=931172 RepID=A0AAV6U6V7_9ARAC|nr:hypothetical protein JTE90_002818 [Oedothorax gibbosus]
MCVDLCHCLNKSYDRESKIRFLYAVAERPFRMKNESSLPHLRRRPYLSFALPFSTDSPGHGRPIKMTDWSKTFS